MNPYYIVVLGCISRFKDGDFGLNDLQCRLGSCSLVATTGTCVSVIVAIVAIGLASFSCFVLDQYDG